MPTKVFFLVYVSSAIVPFSESAQLALLEQSLAKNFLLGITGLLLSHEGNFMQMLEGPEKSVRKLAAEIERDPRHRGFNVLIVGYTDTRQFPDWKMAFKSLSLRKENFPAGYSDFLNIPLIDQESVSDLTLCQRLLLSFKKNQR